MQNRRPSDSGTCLPDYTAVDGNAPPAYPLDDLSGAPARPKEAHTHLPHDETRAGASPPPLADDYVHMQNGLNFDVEANMAAANTNQLAPRIDNPPRRSRHTGLDAFANSFLLCAVIFWPANVFLEFTGDLCHSSTSKVVFCGLPTLAIFFLWIAMFQTKGCWAISREGRTPEQYKGMANTRISLMLSLLLASVFGLWQATFWLCHDGCAKGAGNGDKCNEYVFASPY